MKTKLLLVTWFLAVTGILRAATNDTTAVLQKGLFEEEANHNLNAAIQAYQAVVTQFDQDRKLAATAIFRLGECYRRQGNTNEATAQYQRILREFADQAPLVTLSRQNLSALGASSAVAAAETTSAPLTSAEADEVKRIQAMIKDSPDLINAQDRNGNTPLHTAASKGQVTVVSFLLQNGANVEAEGRNDRTPLYEAAVNGHKTVVELLLEHHAKVNSTTLSGETALHAAAEKGFQSVVEVLVTHGADVNAKTADGVTPLHLAVWNGSKAVAGILLAHGADVNASCSYNPGHNFNPTPVRNLNGTPLHIAAQRGDEAMAALLLDHKAAANSLDGGGQTPLDYAAGYGQVEVAKLLLTHGADPNSTESHGWTPLFYALTSESPRRDEIIAPLLKAGANPNAKFEFTLGATPGRPNPMLRRGYTPLLLATYKGLPEAVDLLLAHKADPNLKSEEGDAPIVNAVLYGTPTARGHMVAALLDHGADPNVRDPQGATPLLDAVLDRDRALVDLFLAHRADVNARNENNGGTALHYLAQYSRQVDVTALGEDLLSAGAEVNVLDNAGRTPLKTVLEALRTTPEVNSNPREFADLLRRHGAVENVPNRNGIEIRHGRGDSSVAFAKGTNDWNHFTTFELLGAQLGFLAARPSIDRRTREDINLLFVNGDYGPQRRFSNPDFSRMHIKRPTQNPKDWQDMVLDINAALESGDCSKNIPLEWGDVVEIPQSDRPINDEWRGFDRRQVQMLFKCLARHVKIIIGGEATEVTLGPEMDGLGYVVTQTPFWLKPVLQARLRDLSDQRRATLDVAHVKVTRPDPTTVQKREWVLDCSEDKPAPGFWLRDGDVVEVPEKMSAQK